MAVTLVPAHGRWAFPAGSTSLSQFTFVALTSSGQLVAPSANALAIGVLDDAPPLAGATLNANGSYSGGYVVGVNYGIVFEGVMKVQAAASLNPMTIVACNSSGQAVAASGSGTYILGVTMAACASGDLVPVKLSLSGALHN